MITNPIYTIQNSGLKWSNNKLLNIPSNVYSLTISTSTSGTASSDALIGTENYQTKLYATPSAGCQLSGWDVTGGSVQNNIFTFGNTDATIEPIFYEAHSAMLFSSLEETQSTALNIPFTANCETWPYVAIKFDWKITQSGTIWAYNRSCATINTRGHYGLRDYGQPILNVSNNVGSAINEASIHASDSTYTVYVFGKNPCEYATIMYAWDRGNTGFSAYCDGIWRMKDERENGFSTLENLVCTNEVTVPYARTFCVQNFKVAGFENPNDITTNW